MVEESGISSVAVKCVDIGKNTSGEGGFLGHFWRWGAKARVANGIRYPGSPSPKRCSLGVKGVDPFSAAANALSEPPGNYDRKIKTQKNWLRFVQAVEHVV